jgi:dTDP-4-amino-4,6-dideoxygalactose transaminase
MRVNVPAQAYEFSDADIDEIAGQVRTLLSTRAYLTLGEQGRCFEEEFAAHHHASSAVAVNSGTAALEIILRALGVAGGEVIVPTNTFAATAFAVIAAGARPVFADVLPDLTVDPADVARCLTARTRAVITVHIGGLISPATLDLVARCADAGVPLVEDAAHAHGATLDGRFAGSFGVAAAFSFFSTKVITSGEGGMVLTNDARVRDHAMTLRDQAKVGGRNYHELLGNNWRLSEMQAIVGRVQLKRLGEFVLRRQALAAVYDESLVDIPGLRTLHVPARVSHNYYKYICFLEGRAPAEVALELKSRGVALGGNVYDIPLHEQPVFDRFRDRPLPIAEDLCRRHIALPLYPAMTSEQARFVATALRAVLGDS